MIALWRQSAFPALFIAVGVGFIHFGAHAVSCSGQKFGGPAAHWSRLDEDCESEDGLDYRVQILVGRAIARDRFVKELLEGRLTLLQAAARFRDVEAALPLPCDMTRPDKGTLEGERLCQLVIECSCAWFETYSAEHPDAIRARLEEELEQSRDPDGVVHLPKW